MMKLLGLICIILSGVTGLWVGLYLCLYCGIVNIVDACKATPLDGGLLAWGIVRVLMSSAAGGLTVMIGIFAGSLLSFAGKK